MKYKKEDIVLVHFPFSNLKESKIRPALVIIPLEGENIILCQISTKKRGLAEYEVPLNKSSCEGDIRFDSHIYIDMLFTLHETLILGKIGNIKEDTIKEELESKLKSMLFD